MIEAISAATCKCGGRITKVFKSGKPGKYCQQCRDRQAGCFKGSWRTGPIACAQCTTPFLPKTAHQRFCSDQCKYRDRDRRESATGLPRADYLAAMAAKAKASQGFACAHCGLAAVRKLSGTNSAAGYVNKYCSLSCRDAAYIKAGLELRLAKGLFSACFGLYCQVCSKPFVSRRERRVCSASCDARARGQAAHVQAARSVRCEDCGLEFCPMYGRSHATLCQPCSKGRKRAYRLTGKTVRRRRQRAATVELVDPFVVFERDGWACQICGIETPRSKRGTYDADAPELDHVLALAAGSEHSYKNTQCACRRCNALKSDRPIEDIAWRQPGVEDRQLRGCNAAKAQIDMPKGGVRGPN